MNKQTLFVKLSVNLQIIKNDGRDHQDAGLWWDMRKGLRYSYTPLLDMAFKLA